MSIKIRKDGINIEVDTETELKMVLDTLQGNSTKEQVTQNTAPTKSMGTSKPIHELITELFKGIDPARGEYTIFKLLRENSDGMTDSELKEKLELSGPALGGIIGGIGRRTARFGIRKDAVIKVQRTSDGHLKYKLADEMLKVMQENAST